MISIVEGGHWKKKGYHFKLYLNVPSLVIQEVPGLITSSKVKKISFPTFFELTSNEFYCNMSISILGLGLGLKIHIRSENDKES